MKQLLTVIILFLVFKNTSAQHSELRVSLSSGMFSFSGASALSVTSLNYYDLTETAYLNSYGSKSGLCYGFSLNVERVTTGNIILGIEAGYESLRSKVSINRIDGYDGTTTYQYDATGKGYQGHEFLNSYPFIGYRFVATNLFFDLTGGFDFGYTLRLKDKANATAVNGIKYTVSSTGFKDIRFDFRPRIQLAAYYGKTGIYFGYSYGLLNYEMWTKGGNNNEAFARLIRFGITYRIK